MSRKLCEQWVEELDGKKHMLKAVPSVDIGTCTACDFEGQESKCAGFPNSVCGSNSNSFIIKDLGILNEDGLLPCPFCGEPSSGIASIRGIAFVKISANFICKKCEAQITFCADTVEHCLDAWNRRA